MSRRKSTPANPSAPVLNLHTVKLTEHEANLLKRLADELADRTGRASSRSATLRALIRLSAQFDGAMLERLASAMAAEFYTGVHWGKAAKNRR
jgi:hypothetical protein